MVVARFELVEVKADVEVPEGEHPAGASWGHGNKATQPSICKTLRGLFWTVYVPTALLALGSSLSYPTLPVYALSLNLNGLWLGVALAGLPLGRLSTNVLSSQVLALVGVRATMVLSFLVSAVASMVASVSVGFWSLSASLLLMGFGASLESLGRMTYSKLAITNEHRGRAISLLGGTTRIGCIIGPGVGGLIAQSHGLRASFLAQAPIFLVAAAICAVSFPREIEFNLLPGTEITSGETAISATCKGVLRGHWRMLVVSGVAMFVLSFLRGARVTLMPLCAHSIGLGTDQIGLAMAISYIIDSALFPFVGFIADTYGRKRSGIPSFILLTTGLIALTGADSFLLLMLTGMLTGAGNGLSSGLVMMTGTDLAPPHPETSIFLGFYAGFSDSGESLAPLLIGLVSKAADFRTAGIVVCCIGALGIPWYACLVPEGLSFKREAKQMSWPVEDDAESDVISIVANMAIGKSMDVPNGDGTRENKCEGH